MGIFTALAFFGTLVVLTGMIEGIGAACTRWKERRTWKAQRAVYYPKYYY